MSDTLTARETENALCQSLLEIGRLQALLRVLESSCRDNIEKLKGDIGSIETVHALVEIAERLANTTVESLSPVETYLRRKALEELNTLHGGPSSMDIGNLRRYVGELTNILGKQGHQNEQVRNLLGRISGILDPTGGANGTAKN